MTDTIEMSEDRLALLETDERLNEDLDFAYWGGLLHRLNRPDVFVSGFLLGPRGLAKLLQGADSCHDDRPFLEYTISNRSRLHRRFEIGIVRRIRENIDPFDHLLNAGWGWQDTHSRSIRENDLGDIVTSVLRMPVNDLWSAGRHRFGGWP